MPNRIPTPSVPTPAVRTSKSAQPAAKPLTLKETARVKEIAKTVKPKPNPTFLSDGKGAYAGTAKTKGFKFGGGTE
jgi:hypothetical protein